MRLLTAALVLLATPTLAETWADQSCGFGVVRDGKSFAYIADGEPVQKVRCDVTRQQAGETFLVCDGKKAVVRTDGTGEIDGIELFAVTKNGPICD